jgi:large subunit ribosomal protein L10
MRPEKTSILNEIRAQANGAAFVFLVNYQGLNVEQFAELRRLLRGVNAELHVVKNRLFRLVAGERGWQQLQGVLAGPTAMIVGQDIAGAGKILDKFRADNKLPTVKAGVLADAYLTPAAIAEIAQLPPLEALRGKFVGVLAAPLARLVGALQQKVASILYVLKAIEEKKRA